MPLSQLFGGTRSEATPGERMLDMTGKFLTQWNTVDAYQDKQNLEAAHNNLIGKIQQRGGDINSIDFNDINNLYDWQAYGLMRKQDSENKKNDQQAYASMLNKMNMQYSNEIYPHIRNALESYNQGNIDAFSQSVEAVSNSLALPFRYKYDPNTKQFTEFFRSDQAMGFAPTGRTYSSEQVRDIFDGVARGTMPVAAGVGQQMYVNPSVSALFLRGMQATDEGNVASALQPKQMIGPDGRTYLASVQNPLFDKTSNRSLHNLGSTFVVFDPQTGQKVGVMNSAQATQGGFRWADQQDMQNIQATNTLNRAIQHGEWGPEVDPYTHQAMTGAGYIWNKDNRAYYKGVLTDDGKVVIDPQQAASRELWDAFRQRRAGGGGIDPLGLHGGIITTRGKQGSIADDQNNPWNLSMQGSSEATPRRQRFQRFSTPEEGTRAAYHQFERYIQGSLGKTVDFKTPNGTVKIPTNTLRGMVHLWQSGKRDKPEQVVAVMQKAGLNVDAPVNPNTPEGKQAIAQMMSILAVNESSWKISPQQILQAVTGRAAQQQKPQQAAKPAQQAAKPAAQSAQPAQAVQPTPPDMSVGIGMGLVPPGQKDGTNGALMNLLRWLRDRGIDVGEWMKKNNAEYRKIAQ